MDKVWKAFELLLVEPLFEVVVALITIPAAIVLLPVLTFGWVKVDLRWGLKHQKAISRMPNGSYLIEAELAAALIIFIGFAAFFAVLYLRAAAHG